MGDVIGDLSSRRGKVDGMDSRGNARVVTALVPMAEILGYATDPRSRTQGRATYTMQGIRIRKFRPKQHERSWPRSEASS